MVTPEDLILSRLDWARETGSELQERDVREILAGVQLQLKVFRVESPAGGVAVSATVGSRGIRTDPFAVTSGSVVELWIDGRFASSRAYLHAG